jgi:hypothetical protein
VLAEGDAAVHAAAGLPADLVDGHQLEDHLVVVHALARRALGFGHERDVEETVRVAHASRPLPFAVLGPVRDRPGPRRRAGTGGVVRLVVV